MEGDEVKAEWHDELFEREIESHGITVAAGTFRPKDGKPFFDNLELSYSQSTLIGVQAVPESEDTDAPSPTVGKSKSGGKNG